MRTIDFVALEGQTLLNISGAVAGSEEIIFEAKDDKNYQMNHRQDCCERVVVEEVIGDVSDLIGSPILLAEEVVSKDELGRNTYESQTWTFYKLSTIKGSVTIRWLGESNGYYSESVDFVEF